MKELFENAKILKSHLQFKHMTCKTNERKRIIKLINAIDEFTADSSSPSGR